MKSKKFLNAVNILSLVNVVVGTINGLSALTGNARSFQDFVGGIAYTVGKVSLLSFVGFVCLFVTLILSSFLLGRRRNRYIKKNFLRVAVIGGCFIGWWQMLAQSSYYVSFFGLKLPSDVEFVRGLGSIIILFSFWLVFKSFFDN